MDRLVARHDDTVKKLDSAEAAPVAVEARLGNSWQTGRGHTVKSLWAMKGIKLNGAPHLLFLLSED